MTAVETYGPLAALAIATLALVLPVRATATPMPRDAAS